MAKKPKFQIPRGMHDILSEDQFYFQKIHKIVESFADFYNFGKIDTPILEESELFSKGIGLSTDVVEKEMYTFRTKGRDLLSLRPEGTASVARAYIEHGMWSLPQPVRLWYLGPFFRYEKPQSGRYREFRQFGFEVLGEKSPTVDAQMIQIFYNILKELHFKNLTIEINSIGCSQCRPSYRKVLQSYLKSHESELCSDCRKRVKENPLRVLDCKDEKCKRVVSQAPQIIDNLCEECHNHFKEVLEFLDELELPYHLNPYLVRGLDYYTKTVFEIYFKEEVDGSQNALLGGGRYDSLIKILGGKETPACGGAAGIERIVEFIKKKALFQEKDVPVPVFLAQLGQLSKKKSLKLLEDFRKAKIKMIASLGKDSLKVQMDKANKLGVRYALILGQKEALENSVIIRDMKAGTQTTVQTEDVVGKMREKLKKI